MSICKYCGGTAPDSTDICRNCGILLKIADSNIDSHVSADMPKTEAFAQHDPKEMLAVAETSNQPIPDSADAGAEAKITQNTEYSEYPNISTAPEKKALYEKIRNAYIEETAAENNAIYSINTDKVRTPAAGEVHELAHLTTIDISENSDSDNVKNSGISSPAEAAPTVQTEELKTLAELSEMTKSDIFFPDKDKAHEEDNNIISDGQQNAPKVSETIDKPDSSYAEYRIENKNNITDKADKSTICAENPVKASYNKKNAGSDAFKLSDPQKRTDIQNTSETTAAENSNISNAEDNLLLMPDSDKDTNKPLKNCYSDEKVHNSTDISSELSPEIMEAVAAMLSKNILDSQNNTDGSENLQEKLSESDCGKNVKTIGSIIKRLKKIPAVTEKILISTAGQIKLIAVRTTKSISGITRKIIKSAAEINFIRTASAIAGKPFLFASKALIKTARFFMGTKYPDGMFTEAEIKENTLIACIAYFPLMFPIPSILRPRSRYLRYHSICGAAETLCMVAVIFIKRLICQIFKNVFTVTVNAGSSFEHMALSRTGIYMISATEIISYIIIFLIFISCITMPVFERKHSLAPDIFYKLAESAYTPDSDNRRNERERAASDTVYKSSGGETVHKTSKADDVPKKDHKI